jgi:hypothetical protein
LQEFAGFIVLCTWVFKDVQYTFGIVSLRFKAWGVALLIPCARIAG